MIIFIVIVATETRRYVSELAVKVLHKIEYLQTEVIKKALMSTAECRDWVSDYI